jgi:hypothetical protein
MKSSQYMKRKVISIRDTAKHARHGLSVMLATCAIASILFVLL